MSSGADLSPCEKYRYRLWRYWETINHKPMVFIMLNPSTADASVDDPTIRRCIGFAKREGHNGVEVVNLYAGRATKPADLFKMADPSGPEWLPKLRQVIASPDGCRFIAAWGANPKAGKRAKTVARSFRDAGLPLLCLGKTKSGAPRHPLYAKNDQPLERYAQ